MYKLSQFSVMYSWTRRRTWSNFVVVVCDKRTSTAQSDRSIETTHRKADGSLTVNRPDALVSAVGAGVVRHGDVAVHCENGDVALGMRDASDLDGTNKRDA